MFCPMQSTSSTAGSVSSIPTHFKYLNKYKAGDYKNTINQTKPDNLFAILLFEFKNMYSS